MTYMPAHLLNFVTICRKIIDHFGIAAYSMHDVEHHGIADVLTRALWDVDKT